MRNLQSKTRRLSSRIARRISSRRGAATVEFAIVAIALFTFFFAAVEFARLNQVANSVALAAYEGCRRAIVPGATAAQASTAAQTSLTNSLVRNGTVTVSPSNITYSTATVTVTISVPMNSNSWILARFSNNATITRSCTLSRELTN